MLTRDRSCGQWRQRCGKRNPAQVVCCDSWEHAHVFSWQHRLVDNTKHLDKVKPRQSRQATVYVVDLLTFVTCPRKARLSRGVLVKKKKKHHGFVCFLRCGCNVQHLPLARGDKDERGQGSASSFYLYSVEKFAQGLTCNLIERLFWIFLFIYWSYIWYTFCEIRPIMLPVGAAVLSPWDTPFVCWL